MKVPGPGGLGLRGYKIRKLSKDAPPAGKQKLSVTPSASAKMGLNRTGEVKVTAEVTYDRDGNYANTESRRIKLVKRR